jgi:sulfite reductase subunit B
MTVASEKPAVGQHEPHPYVPRIGRIVEAHMLTAQEKFYRIVLEDGVPLDYKPGQFVEVSLLGVGECPISICSSPTQGSGFELTVRKAGLVTSKMHELETGDVMGIRGPFGNGFDAEALKGADVLFVAGGLGLAPARGLIRYVLDHRADYLDVTLLIGARTPADLLFTDEIKEWQERPDCNTLVTVDRADETWTGSKGVITKLFRRIKVDAANTWAVIIGPPIMFKFAVLEVLAEGVPENRVICSLERRMKCGLGKCGHCQIRNVYVCQDGPVFTYDFVKRLREGI